MAYMRLSEGWLQQSLHPSDVAGGAGSQGRADLRAQRIFHVNVRNRGPRIQDSIIPQSKGRRGCGRDRMKAGLHGPLPTTSWFLRRWPVMPHRIPDRLQAYPDPIRRPLRVQHSAALLTELTRLPQQGAAYEGRRKRKKASWDGWATV
ncbi:unnamed protein product [Gadus morhua 'NCC']